MTNPNNAVGTNAAYGTRTSVDAFNDVLQVFEGRGVLSGWRVRQSSGMTVLVGGEAGIRDVAIAEDSLGNRTAINNRSGAAISVGIGAASVSSARVSAIVAYANKPAQAVDTTPDAPSVCGIIEVQGTASGVSDAQIRSAITADGGTGSVAYYVVLASVYVGAGATAITDANITQESVEFQSGSVGSSVLADGSVGEAKIDWGSLGFKVIAVGVASVSWTGTGMKKTTVNIPEQEDTDYTVLVTLQKNVNYFTAVSFLADDKTTTSFSVGGWNAENHSLTAQIGYLAIRAVS